MPPKKSEQLTRELNERRILHWRAQKLAHFVLDGDLTPSPWRPPTIPGEVKACPALPERESPPASMKIRNPLLEYNLRLADATIAVAAIQDELRIAGLDERDLICWQANLDVASRIQVDPLVAPSGNQHLYVRAKDNLGDYSIGYSRSERSVTRRRLNAARALLERAATAVRRILQTVGPEAVFNRLQVDRRTDYVVFDGLRYEGLTDNVMIFFHHLRLGAGEWVPSPSIEKAEGIADFRVERCGEFLKRYPQLTQIVETVSRLGSRIVLHLPPL